MASTWPACARAVAVLPVLVASSWPVGFAALRSVLEVVAEIATFGDFCGVSAGNKRGQKNLSFGQPVDNIVANYAN